MAAGRLLIQAADQKKKNKEAVFLPRTMKIFKISGPWKTASFFVLPGNFAENVRHLPMIRAVHTS